MDSCPGGGPGLACVRARGWPAGLALRAWCWGLVLGCVSLTPVPLGLDCVQLGRRMGQPAHRESVSDLLQTLQANGGPVSATCVSVLAGVSGGPRYSDTCARVLLGPRRRWARPSRPRSRPFVPCNIFVRPSREAKGPQGQLAERQCTVL